MLNEATTETQPYETPLKATVALPPTTTDDPLLGGLSPQQQEIIKCLLSTKRLMKPYEISQMTNIPRSSVSARLSELKSLNIVLWKKGGYYEVNPIQNPTKSQVRGGNRGFSLVGWRVQNVRLCVGGLVGGYEKVSFSFGGVGLVVEFGSKRDRVSACVSSDLGLSYAEWLLVLDKLDSVCFGRGYVDLGWRVSMCEFLRDYERRRLDGVSGMTLTRFNESVIEKVYEKPGGVVRHERRIHPDDMPVDVVTSFLANGLQGMDFAGEIQRLGDRVERLTVAVKYVNRGLAELKELLGK